MRFWKKRLQRVAAMVCSVALVASMMPTAVFAEGPEATTPTPEPASIVDTTPTPELSESPENTDATVTTAAPDTGTGSTSAPEATPAGNTDDTKEPEESPEPSEEPTDDTTESGEESTETTDSTTVPSEEPVESPEPSGVPAEEVQLFNAPVQLDLEPAAAPKGIGDETATSNDGIFSVDYYNGPGEKTDLTIIALDEENHTIDTLHLGEVYASTATMTVTLTDENKTVYEITDVSVGDGVYILDWSEDFKDGQSVTFGWADTPEGGNYGKGTIYIHLKAASHVLNLQNADKDIDLGTILWKEDGNAYQRTTVEAYLNYELVYTAKDLPIANTARNFILDVNDGYYFDTARLQDIKYSSNIDGQTLSYTQSNTRLNFNIAPSEVVKGNNVVKLYFFDYNDVTKVDFNRRLDAVDISNPYHPDSCEDMVISFESKGRTYSFLYKDWQDAIALPRNTKITVSPNLGEGYYFEFWDGYDVAAPHNAMYSVLPDGTWEKEGYDTVYYGVLALTQTLGLEFSDSDYPRVSIYLCMTEGKQDDDKVITYHSNYPAETGLEDETYSQYFYNYGAIFRGARIQDDMFQPEGYELVCWTTNQNGTGDKYMPGDLYGNEKGDDDLTLYAQWKKIDTPPVETSVDLEKTITQVKRGNEVFAGQNIPQMLKVGDEITYQINVTNTGDVDLEGLTVTDAFTGNNEPSEGDGITWTGAAGNWTGTISNIELPAGEAKTYKYTCTVAEEDKGKTISNKATINGDDSEDPTDEDEIKTEVENPAVGVEKSLVQVKRGEEIFRADKGTIPEELEVGDELTYEIEVKNIGNVKLNGLTLTDTFNGHFAPSKVKDKVDNVELTNEWEKDTTTGRWTLKIENISPDVGEIETYTYTYIVSQADAGNTLTNTAAVTGDGTDPDDEETDEHPVEDDGDITLRPADITIYMGGEDGYGDSNSLPEPGFYITLPDEVKEALKTKLDLENGEAADLSEIITGVTATTKDGQTRSWTMQKYGADDSTAWIDDTSQAHFVYRIVTEQGQPAISVNFTDSKNNPVEDDHFTLAESGSLSETYFMSLNTASVDVETISLTFNIKGEIFHCGYDAKNSQKGTLTVRYASEGHDTTQAVTSVNEINLEKFGLLVGDSQMFNINQEDAGADGVDVTHEDVSLLADNIVSGNGNEYVKALAEKAQEVDGFASSSVVQAMYLDLVDAENGNAWLTTKDNAEVTVFWPYPEGINKESDFQLIHFKGLDREMGTTEVVKEIEAADAEPVTIIERLEDGFTFKTSSFSPFVLVQNTTQPSGGEDKPSGGDNGNNDNNNNNTNTNNQTTTVNVANQAAAPAAAPAAVSVPQTSDDMPIGALTAAAVAAAAALVGLLVVRKRRQK